MGGSDRRRACVVGDQLHHGWVLANSDGDVRF